MVEEKPEQKYFFVSSCLSWLHYKAQVRLSRPQCMDVYCLISVVTQVIVRHNLFVPFQQRQKPQLCDHITGAFKGRQGLPLASLGVLEQQEGGVYCQCSGGNILFIIPKYLSFVSAPLQFLQLSKHTQATIQITEYSLLVSYLQIFTVLLLIASPLLSLLFYYLFLSAHYSSLQPWNNFLTGFLTIPLLYMVTLLCFSRFTSQPQIGHHKLRMGLNRNISISPSCVSWRHCTARVSLNWLQHVPMDCHNVCSKQGNCQAKRYTSLKKLLYCW